MKPEEAIEILEEIKELDDTLYAYSDIYMKALETAISALEEIQQYRKIGASPERITELILEGSAAKRILGHYQKIGTVEECREAVDKQKAKKCVIDSFPDHMHYKCPSCGKIHLSRYKHGCPSLGRIPRFCHECGQAIDNENLEGMEDVTSEM